MSARPPPPPIRLSSASVELDGRRVLSSVDLEARAGEFLALAGPNGSGKTTLLRAVLGLVPLSHGSVELLGTPLSGLSVRERALRVAWVPQEEALREDVPLERYVLYGRYAIHGSYGREGPSDLARAREILRHLALEDRAESSVLSLSGGERQRATLGRALAQETPVLLLDEPTSHLDIGHQLDLLERVRVLVRERRVSVIAALHDLNLAARFADRIVVLSAGRKVADGPVGQVLSPSLLARVWGVEADLRPDPVSGQPYLVPRRLLVEPPRPAPGHGPVHVVGGGGAASPILRRLTDAGFEVTVGALHLLDTDAETAEALSLAAAVEVPFAPLGPEVRERLARLLAAARAIVVAPFAVGPPNLSNLEDLAAFLPATPTFLFRLPPIAERDFADGRAARAYAELLRRGAREVADLSELIDGLAGLGPDVSAERPRSAGPEASAASAR